jgi:23S rRNA (adenine2503-C2)-methyltransferase
VPSYADYNLAQLQELFASWGYPAIHAKRLLRLYYDSAGQPDLAAILLPKTLRARLEAQFVPVQSQLATSQAAEDQTRKLLVQFADGAEVESVLMPDFREDRAAGCLSSQVGCAMACAFCATGQQGFTRNLTPGEIVEQYLHLAQAARGINRWLRTIVFMGMGEPLLNLPNVLEAIRRIAADEMGHLGWRQVTVSTVGLVPQMHQLTESGLNIQMAVSLHAPSDDLRARLIPVAQRYPVRDVLAAAQRFQDVTGRIVILQYCLLEEVNDTPDRARELASLLAGHRMHVNLLTYNPTGTAFRTSSPERASAFLGTLRDLGVVTHLRRSRGKEIAAACGQLRGRA